MADRLNLVVFTVIGLCAFAQILIAAGGVIAQPDTGGVIAISVSALVVVTMLVLIVITMRRAHRTRSRAGAAPTGGDARG